MNLHELIRCCEQSKVQQLVRRYRSFAEIPWVAINRIKLSIPTKLTSTKIVAAAAAAAAKKTNENNFYVIIVDILYKFCCDIFIIMYV